MFKRKKRVYLVPWCGAEEDNTFFNRPRSACWALLRDRLAKEKIELRVSSAKKIPKNADLVVLQNLYPGRDRLKRLTSRFPKERLMLTVWEPPIHEPACFRPEYQRRFGRVYLLTDDQTDGKHIFHFHYPQPFMRVPDTIPFEKKQLATMVCANKSSSYANELYSKRHRVIEYFESNHNDDFSFYGYGWQHCGYKNYGGTPEDKTAALHNYRFCFSYENSRDVPGYITEKIFDCFDAGCVPIYLGASNIDSYIPRNCFIHREDFNSLDELYTHLKNMSAEEHQRYLDAAECFVKGPQAQAYSWDNFAKTIGDGILAMLGEHTCAK